MSIYPEDDVEFLNALAEHASSDRLAKRVRGVISRYKNLQHGLRVCNGKHHFICDFIGSELTFYLSNDVAITGTLVKCFANGYLVRTGDNTFFISKLMVIYIFSEVLADAV